MKAIALGLLGLFLAVASTGCCCGGCGGGFHGCGYQAPAACGSCAPACSPCSTPTYGQPIQGTYVPPTTSQAAGIPSVMTASAVPLESLPTY